MARRVTRRTSVTALVSRARGPSPSNPAGNCEDAHAFESVLVANRGEISRRIIRGAAAGRACRRGVLRGRRGPPVRPGGRRERAHRAGPTRTELPRRGCGARGGTGVWRAGHSSGLRVPVGERRLRPPSDGCRAGLGWPLPGGDRGHGRQGQRAQPHGRIRTWWRRGPGSRSPTSRQRSRRRARLVGPSWSRHQPAAAASACR